MHSPSSDTCSSHLYKYVTESNLYLGNLWELPGELPRDNVAPSPHGRQRYTLLDPVCFLMERSSCT